MIVDSFSVITEGGAWSQPSVWQAVSRPSSGKGSVATSQDVSQAWPGFPGCSAYARLTQLCGHYHHCWLQIFTIAGGDVAI